MSNTSALASLKLHIHNSLGRFEHEPSHDLDDTFSCPSSSQSNFSTASSPYGPVTPTSGHIADSFDGCLTPPHRPDSSTQFDPAFVCASLSPPPTMGHYMQMPPLQSNSSCVSYCKDAYPATPPKQETDLIDMHTMSSMNCVEQMTPPAEGFMMYNGLTNYPPTLPYMGSSHSYHVQETNPPMPAPMWTYDGSLPLFESSAPPPMPSNVPTTAPRPSPPRSLHQTGPGMTASLIDKTPATRAQDRYRIQKAKLSSDGVAIGSRSTSGSSRKSRPMATLNSGAQCEIYESNKHSCKFPGCGRRYVRPEHLKRHQKDHDIKHTEVYECKICLEKDNKSHRVAHRLDNFINHVRNHCKVDTPTSRTRYDPSAHAYLESLQALQRNRRRSRKEDSSSVPPDAGHEYLNETYY